MEKQKCIIVGAGGQCRVVLSLLQESDKEYLPIGIFDDSVHKNEEILSIPVLGRLDSLEKYYNDGIRNIFLAIGDNLKRKCIYDSVKSAGFFCPNLVSNKANVSHYANIGEANIICPFAHIGPQVNISDNNIINTHTTIEHETVIQSHCHVASASVVSGRSQLGDFVFLGSGTKVIDNLSIASETTVAAGSVVIADIKDSGYLYAGVPAKRKKRK